MQQNIIAVHITDSPSSKQSQETHGAILTRCSDENATSNPGITSRKTGDLQIPQLAPFIPFQGLPPRHANPQPQTAEQRIFRVTTCLPR